MYKTITYNEKNTLIYFLPLSLHREDGHADIILPLAQSTSFSVLIANIANFYNYNIDLYRIDQCVVQRQKNDFGK